MSLSTWRPGKNTIVLVARGSMASPDCQSGLTEAIKGCVNRGFTEVCVDLTHAKQLGMHGLHALMRAKVEAADSGVSLRLHGAANAAVDLAYAAKLLTAFDSAA